MSDYARILELERDFSQLSDQVDNDVGMRLEYLEAEVDRLNKQLAENAKPVTAGEFRYCFEEYKTSVLNNATIFNALAVIGVSQHHWRILSNLAADDLLIYNTDYISYRFMKAELKKLEKQVTAKDLNDVAGIVIRHLKKDKPDFNFSRFSGLLVHNKACGSFSDSLWNSWMDLPNETILTNPLQLKIYNYLAELAKHIDASASKDANE